LLGLDVSEYGVSEPVAIKCGLAANKELYKFKFLPVLQILMQKLVFWNDLASAHYAKDTLQRVGSIRRTKSWIRSKGKKITKRPTATTDLKFLGKLEKTGLQQQLLSKRCKELDGENLKRAEIHWNYGKS
jgi:hypothetical protein